MRRGTIRAALPALAALALAAAAGGQTRPPAPPAAGTNAFHAAYHVAPADAQETLAAVRAMAHGRGSVAWFASSGRLVVHGPPGLHQEVRDLLRALEDSRPNIRVEVTFDERSRESRAGVSVSGGGTISGDRGAIVIGEGGPGANGRHIEARLSSRQADAGGQTRQTLLVRSGGEASLFVGREMPFATELVRWGHDRGYIERNVEWREIGAALLVAARVIGDGSLVELTITPELSGVEQGRRRQVRCRRAAMTVTVADGETTSLAGFGEHEEFYRRFLAGAGRSRRDSDMRIGLRAVVEPSSPRQGR